MNHIQVMFDPKTIALIGATEKEGAVGRTILENLLRSKERKIFPVNPSERCIGCEVLLRYLKRFRACDAGSGCNSCPVSACCG